MLILQLSTDTLQRALTKTTHYSKTGQTCSWIQSHHSIHFNLLLLDIFLDICFQYFSTPKLYHLFVSFFGYSIQALLCHCWHSQFPSFVITDQLDKLQTFVSHFEWTFIFSICQYLPEVYLRVLIMTLQCFFLEHLSMWEWFKVSLWLDSSSPGQKIFLLVQIVVRALAVSA